jgi:hypothetical protein
MQCWHTRIRAHVSHKASAPYGNKDTVSLLTRVIERASLLRPYPTFPWRLPQWKPFGSHPRMFRYVLTLTAPVRGAFDPIPSTSCLTKGLYGNDDNIHLIV